MVNINISVKPLMTPRLTRLCEDALDYVKQDFASFPAVAEATSLNDEELVKEAFYPMAVRSAFHKILSQTFEGILHTVRSAYQESKNTGDDYGTMMKTFSVGQDFLESVEKAGSSTDVDNSIAAEKFVMMCRSAMIYTKRVHSLMSDERDYVYKDEVFDILQELYAIYQIFATGSPFLPEFMQVVDVGSLISH